MRTKILLKSLIAACMLVAGSQGAKAAATTSLTTSTTITFDGTTAGTYQGEDGSHGGETTFDIYSLAYYGTGNNRVITSKDGTKSGTIAGENYSVSKYLTMNSTIDWTTNTFTKRTAGGNNLGNSTFAPCIAFNTGVAGTVYVSVQRRGSGNGSLKVAYQTAAEEDNKYKLVAFDDKNFASDTDVKEYAYTIPEATTVLIRGNMNIYAVRFVPAPTERVVTFGNAMKATFSANENFTIPTGVTAYYVSSYDDASHKAIITKINGVIPANQGVVLFSDAVGDKTFVATADEAPSIGTNYLKPVLEAFNLQATETIESTTYWNYTLAADGFVHSNGEGTLAAGKAYLQIPYNVTEAQGAKIMFFFADVTGIETIQNSEFMMRNEAAPVYNLSGQRVGADYKGMVIKNGKKVIMK